MDKSVDAFRTIGEMARELNVKTHILRYWEEQFPMLRPLKRAGGRRHYRPDDVQLLKQIHRLLNDEGYTIKGARKFLSSGAKSNAAGSAPVSAQSSAAASSGGVSASELRAVRDRLSSALETA
ncbi:MAG: MerR family transcriptional regulator [Sphingorhabdus sp.]